MDLNLHACRSNGQTPGILVNIHYKSTKKGPGHSSVPWAAAAAKARGKCMGGSKHQGLPVGLQGGCWFEVVPWDF